MLNPDNISTAKALFHTFGCKLNFAETSTVSALFAARGISRVQRGDTPDIIVINSCSVTDVADKKCRQAIRAFHRRYPDAPIIVTGCYAQLDPETVCNIPGVAFVAGNDRKHLLDKYLDQWLEDHKPSNYITPAKDISTFTPSCSRGDRTRYFLKVQDGCDYWCSYCTIPKARGRSRSPRVETLVELARKVAREGGKEIVLTGVNIGDFGHGTDETFLDLVKELDKVEGIERYRISSIEPNLLTDEIIDFVAASQRFMPHFHIPLQCGSDDVLRLMRRRYDTSVFTHKVKLIKEIIPHAFIGVDLITGSRGETDDRFLESYKYCASLPVSRLHVFPYSERPGTRALELEGKVDPAVARVRTNRMLRLSEDKLEKFISAHLGTVRPVLIEHLRPGHQLTGLTDNYIRVVLPTDTPMELYNTIVPVRLIEFDVRPDTHDADTLAVRAEICK